MVKWETFNCWNSYEKKLAEVITYEILVKISQEPWLYNHMLYHGVEFFTKWLWGGIVEKINL